MNYAGAELEDDFQLRWGIDLLDFFRGTLPWGKFLRLVERLPTASAYRNKFLKDGEIARLLFDPSEEESPATAPDLQFTDETTVVQLLRKVIDLLQHQNFLTAGSTSARPPAPSPRPRPAIDVLREECGMNEVDKALEMMTGSTWEG